MINQNNITSTYTYKIGTSRILYIILVNIICLGLFWYGYFIKKEALQLYSTSISFITTTLMLKPTARSYYRLMARGKTSDKSLIPAVIVVLILLSYGKYLEINNLLYNPLDPLFIVIVVLSIFILRFNAIRTQIRTRHSNKDGKYPDFFYLNKTVIIIGYLIVWGLSWHYGF